MKKLTGLSLAALAAAALLGLFSSHIQTRLSEREKVLEERSRLTEEARISSEKHLENASEKLAKIFRLEDLEKFNKGLSSLSKEEYEALAPVLRAKLFEANFLYAEGLLESAGGLLRADENHPTGREYLERARKIYEKIDKLLKQGIPERPSNHDGNARLSYLKGVYYYNSMVIIALTSKDIKAEMARLEELIGLSAKHFSSVFQYKPRDRDTEVALEILQKKAESMGAAQSSGAKLQLELLPSRGSKRGPGFAIEGGTEGRH